MKNKKQIGVMSGTFDPFHLAHLEVCLLAQQQCQLDEVLILLERTPHHKPKVSSYKNRAKMINLAITDFRQIKYLKTGFDNLTINNVLPLLSRDYPNCQYWYIIGSDILSKMSSWQSLDRLLSNMNLCIILRDGTTENEVVKKLHTLGDQKLNQNYKIIPQLDLNISSSLVRKQIKELKHSNLLHKDSLNFVLTNKMYND